MPSWRQVYQNLSNEGSQLDSMRRKYLGIMAQYTDRNVIAYYSAFLQKRGIEGTAIDDSDKNAFMEAVCGLDKRKGLDLILHTPGGELGSTESIVYYLKKLFNNDIRVFVPQIAMSAGTMIALSSREIVMGKESNLGPIDPVMGGMSCAGVVAEFKRALADVSADSKKAGVWGPIIAHYYPTFVGECEKAISWGKKMVKEWLTDNMFKDAEDATKKAEKVVKTLSSHDVTFSHSRHIHADDLKKLGLKIVDLEGLDDHSIEDCKDLQDCVLTIHHTYMHTFSNSDAIKIVENHEGNAMIVSKRVVQK